jgi:hypothetical protein
MNDWFSLNLGDGVQADEPSELIKDSYQAAFISSGGPIDMAVFNKRNQGEKRNLITAYFTPSSSSLANTFGATPCEKPTSDDLSLLVGNQAAWDIHFPSRKTRHERNT